LVYLIFQQFKLIYILLELEKFMSLQYTVQPNNNKIYCFQNLLIKFNMTKTIEQIAQKAKHVSPTLANLSSAKKNQILLRIGDHLKQNSKKISKANQLDVKAAEEMVKNNTLSLPLLNRLKLNDEKINQLSVYLEEVSKLEDPVGKKQFAMELDTGLELTRLSCPIGVLAVIFESRPEVVIQVSALSLKSGNAVILKGGREASHSNRVLFELIDQVLAEFELSGAVNLIETREDVAALLDQDEHIDLIIPRGSNEFVRYIQDNTKIPVLGHSSGICHIYIDKTYDIDKAIPVTIDAKIDYPSACNAVETLLLHEDAAKLILPQLIGELNDAGIKILACENTLKLSQGSQVKIEPATAEDWKTEYSDLVLSVKIVPSVEAAVNHINQFSSHHTDTIITEDPNAADYFMKRVDSGCVFHNVSTRFSDGYVFGLGAEVGISTNKTHSRGPVGLEGLVIYKYLLSGNGQKRASYSGENAKVFKHKKLPLN